MPDLPASAILKQCEAWVKSTPNRPAILRPRDRLVFYQRVRSLFAPLLISDEELLRGLHKQCAMRAAVRVDTVRAVNLDSRYRSGAAPRALAKKPAARKKGRGGRKNRIETAPIPERFSKSGRRTKLPSKFKDIDNRPYRRDFRQVPTDPHSPVKSSVKRSNSLR